MRFIAFPILLFSCLSVSLLGQISQEFCRTGHARNSGRADASALDTRSDSIDITHTQIHLDFSNLPAQLLIGECAIHFKAKVDGINNIELDLLSLTVDSIKQNNQLVLFDQVDEKINVELSNPLQTGDTTSLTVYYRGLPGTDAVFCGFSF
jgi:aminopeptidase N